MASRARRPEDASTASDLGRYAGLGVQFAAAICVLGALGWWLDGKLGTGPWLLIVGIFAGAVGGFVAVLKAVPGSTRPSRVDRDPPSHPRP
ncbi:MAG: AtpZ/AtpI family protein [Planctomycetota bacterium]